MIAGGGSGDLESGAGRVGDGAEYSARGNCGSTLSEPQSYGTLSSAIAAHPDRLGIGIDEDTCAMVEAMVCCK